MNTISGFKMCADCANKRLVDIDVEGKTTYYCALVDGIIREGIVYDSTDASACIEWNLFKPLDFTTNQE